MNKIVTYPNDILRVVTDEVKEVDGKMQKRIDKLKEYLKNCSNAVGLSAPQMGWKDRVFGIKSTENDDQIVVYVNPKIVKTWGKEDFLKVITGKNNDQEEEFLEGCLSFPNIFGTVKRFYKIEVEWMGGNKIMEGFEAVVFQHELDHLNGILLIDRIKESSGKVYRIMGEKKEELELQNLMGR